MGFSVPTNFHKSESECHLLQFKSDSTDDMLFLAVTVYNPDKQLIHKKYDTIPKNEIDDQGDLSALISGLILCLENNIKTIYIEGDCTIIRREKAEILNKLFDEFSYVYFKDTITEPNELDALLTSSHVSLQASSPP
jgi:hypothetical protein